MCKNKALVCRRASAPAHVLAAPANDALNSSPCRLHAPKFENAVLGMILAWNLLEGDKVPIGAPDT